jgi:hypothetical protein
MRALIACLCFILPTCLRAAPVAAEAPAPLSQALLKIAQERGHWAYTQTDVIMNAKGKVLNETVVRYDPSKPYAEQFAPLEIDGRPPTQADFSRYREQGERIGRRVEEAESEGRPPPGQSLGELVDIAHATVATENADTVTYEVPLRADNNRRFPPDKFRVLALVDKAHGTLDHVSVHLRAPFRLLVLAKVKSGELDVDFKPMDSLHNPPVTAIHGNGMLSILFVNVARDWDLKRTDFKRVTPFGERFNVRIGPVKALDF